MLEINGDDESASFNCRACSAGSAATNSGEVSFNPSAHLARDASGLEPVANVFNCDCCGGDINDHTGIVDTAASASEGVVGAGRAGTGMAALLFTDVGREGPGAHLACGVATFTFALAFGEETWAAPWRAWCTGFGFGCLTFTGCSGKEEPSR